MADYTHVLARAIAGRASFEDRRVIYDRARTALVNQLRAHQPPLAEGDITRQRLALEEAIRKVEAEAQAASVPPPAAPLAPAVTPAPLPSTPPLPPTAVAATAPASAPARATGPLPPPQTPAPAPSVTPPASRDAGAPAAATPARPGWPESAAPAPPPTGRLPVPGGDPLEGLPPAPAKAGRKAGRGDPALVRVRTLPAAIEPSSGGLRRSPAPLVVALAVLVLAGGAGVAGFALLGGFGASSPSAPTPRPETGPAAPPKMDERVQREGEGGDPPSGPAVAQHSALLYEENADAARGADEVRGRVAWRLDLETNAQGQERVLRGLVDMPTRGLKMLMTIRRNTDAALPASHTIELLFDVGPTFPHGAVETVAGVRMKPSEQANGVPLAGASARITGGYFLIGLTALGPERDRNIELLRERPWMDVPLVYRNGRRAVLALEKGAAGEAAFAQAFQAWGN